MKTSNEIRKDFLEFFRSKGHTIVPSSSLVPGNDPTLLFTNAGMVQFKDVFLGAEKRSYKRAVSSQRCVRAGGKHNDLDQVGYTARHHTFFEMLGNFSFGDYFKKDAIAYAWELLTKVWGLPADKLLVTIYHTDDEAFDIWHTDIGLPADRIIRIGDNKGAPYASDNFWQMADTGPCGPCTEIFYDHGAHIPGGPPGSPDEDGDRFIEIWNNVFMQYDRQPDGTLVPLPAPCVDTGMGLERVSAVLQHVHSNYEIDLFQHLIKAAAELTGEKDLESKSLRVIADHIRACAFLIVDGVLPSNEGRGYVLRRIIRRALRYGWMLGMREPFFHRMLAPLIEVMGEAYPELKTKRATIEAALKGEEERFAETLDSGMKIFDEVSLTERRSYFKFCETQDLDYGLFTTQRSPDGKVTAIGVTTADDGRYVITRVVVVDKEQPLLTQVRFGSQEQYGPDQVNICLLVTNSEIDVGELSELTETFGQQIVNFVDNRRIEGRDVFRLYDTYGFPVDLTADIARERGLSIDMAGFEAAMEQQREQARAASKFAGSTALPADLVAKLKPTEFLGYEDLEADDLHVRALLRDGKPVDALNAGEQGTVILRATPFYAESGGQVGDRGWLLGSDDARFEVDDTLKLAGQFHGHAGTLKSGTIRVGDLLSAQVDGARRQAIVLNHSATHLLHAALRQVLGEHVTQKGSLVAPDRLRFDFSHFAAISQEQLAEIEAIVNTEIRRNAEAEVHHMGMQEAIDFGAMALFGEKYGERVRVLKMGGFSTELCGGTHVHHTGDIGVFKIISEGGVAAGVRRIEAVTGQGALDFIAAEERRLDAVAELLGGNRNDVVDKLRALFDKQKKLEKELDALKAKAAAGATSDLGAGAVDIAGIKVVAARVDGLDAKSLRDSVDQLKHKLGDAVILLASGADGKASLVAGVQGKGLDKVKAGELVAFVASKINGKGGGRPDMAQGGGEDGAGLVDALKSVPEWVGARLRT
ncbi:alanine--tRNA ligase [Chiayiivirga flava]|uniref:Alanine--tRNA ligase n=1 Tax=Chiayiivirga flava TaxID=659595 RepID=A0A7W8D7G3_9GAMM|nr:alanine--tRNA ligase [Chiayiivirga flava]MBB5209351.1 alanyl-tRNA synthetase [Chiayiivirga flava]